MKILHAGCGNHPFPFEWWPAGVQEFRYDIDPQHGTEYQGSITDLSQFDDNSFDGVYCAHTLEHLYPHDVQVAVGEFYRVLRPGGHIVLLVPDLEDIRPTEDLLYMTPCRRTLPNGEVEEFLSRVTGIDLIYGLRVTIVETVYMAHHIGFNSTTLAAELKTAGFSRVETKRLPVYNLMGAAIK
jgi:ubiquinone/menaquinone biosynthesis C-methylase UbiE